VTSAVLFIAMLIFLSKPRSLLIKAQDSAAQKSKWMEWRRRPPAEMKRRMHSVSRTLPSTMICPFLIEWFVIVDLALLSRDWSMSRCLQKRQKRLGTYKQPDQHHTNACILCSDIVCLSAQSAFQKFRRHGLGHFPAGVHMLDVEVLFTFSGNRLIPSQWKRYHTFQADLLTSHFPPDLPPV
jgi:hypothetical protein